MDFAKVLGALAYEFKKHDIEAALIGGLALGIAGVGRTTYDVDFMAPLKDSDKIHRIMTGLGYECLYRTENVANYHGLSAMGQVDFLFAHRKYSLAMLKRAQSHSFGDNLGGHSIKAVRPEDLIGLKVQASSNDAARAGQDLSDIRNILRVNKGGLDMKLVREYFKLFDRERELDAILKEKK